MPGHHNRYPFSAKAVVYFSKDTSEATIENIGRDGTLFKTQIPLLPGKTVRLVIDWPVKRDGGVQLVLELKGSIVRTDDCGTELTISRYRLGAREPNYDGLAPNLAPPSALPVAP